MWSFFSFLFLCINAVESPIFPDKTLIEMAKYKPTSSEELEKIFGVGKAKLKKFGKNFINVISGN